MLLRNNLIHFTLLVAIMLLFTYEFNTFIQTDQIVTQSFSEKYTQEIIARYIDLRHEWSWIAYLFVPLALYLSTSVIALIILLVIDLYYIHDTDKKVRFKDTWRIVLIAQWSSVTIVFVKTIWFGFFTYTIPWKTFSPFSRCQPSISST